MTTETELMQRGNSKCELCTSDAGIAVYNIPPNTDMVDEKSIILCGVCTDQIENPESMDPNHWRCLNDSMWSEFPAVQVMAWRAFNAMASEGWAQDLKSQMYMDETTQAFAECMSVEGGSAVRPTKDSNGAALVDGDNVTLIKDLVVKGANFTAKRGTMVRNISLTDNPLHIEGKVNGTQIVLITAYLKKQ